MRYLSLRFFLAVLALLTFSRLTLSLWLCERVTAAGGLWPVMSGGFRIDIVMISMMLVLPAVLSSWLGHLRWPTWLTAWWFRSSFVLFALLEVCSPQFLIEYDSRPNRLFFEYLSTPREVAAMLLGGYKDVLLAAALVLMLAIWVAVRLFPVYSKDQAWPCWRRAISSVVVLAVGILAIRGTLEHRPINPSTVAFSSDAMVNTLPLNGLYSVLYAAYRMKDECSSAKLYPSMAPAHMHTLVRQTAGFKEPWLDPDRPSLHMHTASVRRDKPLNLVIIIQESLGAQYIKSLGGQDLTPRLDALSKQGWMFERAYATGTRSARGLEAITAGFLPTAAEAVLKLPRAQNGFFTLADLLGRHGYDTRFIYGGEGHFDNMRSFFLGNGFDQMLDRKTFKQTNFVGSWGASDEDMYAKLDSVLREQPANKPALTVAFTVTNHTPWEYPAGRIIPQNKTATVENTVRYVDWALGEFFDKARASSYWAHTVFLVIADHDSRVFGASLVPVSRFHIPALIVGADIEPRRDPRIVSQIDMAPTLLSLIGLDTIHPMVGADLTLSSPNRALMQYGDNFGYLKGDALLVYEPSRPAHQWHYSVLPDGNDCLTPETTSSTLAREALAYALWPSWMYLNEAYHLPRP